MTPLGHIAVSYTTAQLNQKLYTGALIFGGLIPDIDFVLLPFSFFNAVHRVVTHNVFFLLVAIIVLWFFYRKHPEVIKVLLSFAAGVIIHFFFDAILDNNPGNGIGIALFWPVTAQTFSPFNLLKPIESEGWQNVFTHLKVQLPLLLWEIPFYIIAGIVYIKKYLRSKTH